MALTDTFGNLANTMPGNGLADSAKEGLSTGMDWALKARQVGIAQKDLEMKMQQHEMAKQKWSLDLAQNAGDDVIDILRTDSPKYRNAKIQRFTEKMQAVGKPISPLYAESLKDQDFSNNYGARAVDLLGKLGEDGDAQLADQFVSSFGNPDKGIEQLDKIFEAYKGKMALKAAAENRKSAMSFQDSQRREKEKFTAQQEGIKRTQAITDKGQASSRKIAEKYKPQIEAMNTILAAKDTGEDDDKMTELYGALGANNLTFRKSNNDMVKQQQDLLTQLKESVLKAPGQLSSISPQLRNSIKDWTRRYRGTVYQDYRNELAPLHRELQANRIDPMTGGLTPEQLGVLGVKGKSYNKMMTEFKKKTLDKNGKFTKADEQKFENFYHQWRQQNGE
jgi:hypothetical protein